MTYITRFCEYKLNAKVTCSNPLLEKAYNYSINKYGKPLCFGHQRRTDEDGGHASQKDYEESEL